MLEGKEEIKSMLESQAFREHAPLIAQLQKDHPPDGTATPPAVPEDDDDDEGLPQASLMTKRPRSSGRNIGETSVRFVRRWRQELSRGRKPVSYTHLRAHETGAYL
eukprot:9480655-Pyramimonas_sp.AAC.1